MSGNAKQVGKVPTQKKPSLLHGGTNPVSGGANTNQNSSRPSVVPQGSLLHAAGVGHLNDKRNSGLLLFKNQKNHQRENKCSIDYYTLQNSKTGSTQPSTMSTSRAGIMTGSLPLQQLNSKGGQIELKSSDVVLRDGESKDLSQQSQSKIVLNVSQAKFSSSKPIEPKLTYHRSSIKPDQGKHRAVSNHKNVSSKFGTAQTAQINLTWKGYGKSNIGHLNPTHAYGVSQGGNSTKVGYKKSMIVASKLNQSPNPSRTITNSSTKNNISGNIYRSPQTNKAVEKANSSPIVTNQAKEKSQNHSQVRAAHQLSNASNINIKPVKDITITMKTQELPKSAMGHQGKKHASRGGNPQTSKTMHNLPPSCLQIDLSSLSNKNEEDMSHGYVGGKTEDQKKLNVQSVSSQKQTNSIISQSPNIGSHTKSPLNSQHKALGTSPSNDKKKKKAEGELMFKSQKAAKKEPPQKLSKPVSKKVSNAYSKQEVESFSQQTVNVEQESFTGFGTNLNQNSDEGHLNDITPIPNEEGKSVVFKIQNNEGDRIQSQQMFESVTPDVKNVASPMTINKSLSTIERPPNAVNKFQMVNLDDDLEEEEPKIPSKAQFLAKHKEKLLPHEILEIESLKQDKLYFIGQLLSRSGEELKLIRAQEPSQLLEEFDDEEGYYNVLLNDHLSYRYEVLKILGKGSFAQVVSCLDHKTGEKVAVKITRNTELDHKFANSESRLLNYLMEKDPADSHNVVRMIDEFMFREHHCFVFELLHSDLFEYMKANGFLGFSTGLIRAYAIQILEALVFLEDHSIIHCDLKPENILLIDEQAKKLKLVDYGSGCFKSEQAYTYVQSRFYRAPEVILRLNYSEKVDIWSFGCILAELYTGEPLFPGNNEQEQLELIMEVCGIIPEQVIDKSRKKYHYFYEDYSPRLIEDEELGILRIPASTLLSDSVPCQDKLFLSFINDCLELDPEKRMSARQAIQHPWLKDLVHSSSPKFTVPPLSRRREQECDGVKVTAMEESPQRQEQAPTKTSLKAFNFHPVKMSADDQDRDSDMSTPKSEGSKNKDPINFGLMEEKVREEDQVHKPTGKKKDEVKMVGQYEIVREGKGKGESNPKKVPKGDEGLVNNENAINKITITVYQKKNAPANSTKNNKK